MPPGSRFLQVKAIAQKFLSDQLAYFSTDPDFAKPTQTEITAAIDRIAQYALATTVEKSTLFNARLIEHLRARARGVSLSIPRNPADPPPGAQPTAEQEAQFEQVTQKVKAELLNYLKSLPDGFTAADTPGPNTILPADERFLESIVRDVVIPRAQSVDAIPGRRATDPPAAKLENGEILIVAPPAFWRRFEMIATTIGAAEIVTATAQDRIHYNAIREGVVERLGHTLSQAASLDKSVPKRILPKITSRFLSLPVILPAWDAQAIRVVLGEDRRAFLANTIDQLRSDLCTTRPKHLIMVLPPGNVPAEVLPKIDELLRPGGAVTLHLIKFGPGLLGSPLRSLVRAGWHAPPDHVRR